MAVTHPGGEVARLQMLHPFRPLMGIYLGSTWRKASHSFVKAVAAEFTLRKRRSQKITLVEMGSTVEVFLVNSVSFVKVNVCVAIHKNIDRDNYGQII